MVLKRPEPGTVTRKEEIRVEICPECGYRITSGELCDSRCSLDGWLHRNLIVAVYEVTEIFIRDEREGG